MGGTQTIWDPIVLLGKFTNPFVVVLCMAALTIATLSTNLAANVVSPSIGFANVAPKKISLRTGGLIEDSISPPSSRGQRRFSKYFLKFSADCLSSGRSSRIGCIFAHACSRL